MEGFLTCFPILLRRGRPSSSRNNIDEPLRSFSSLVTDIDRLKTSLAGDCISLKWCSEAINLLRKMHFQFLLFMEKSNAPISREGINIVDEYMKETLDLLDLCNSLKLAMSGMGRYRLMVDFAVRKLHDHGFPDKMTKTEIESLESETKKIYGAEKWKDMNPPKTDMSKTKGKNSAVHFICAIKATHGAIGMLIFSALLYPIEITVNEEVYREFPQLKPLSLSLGRLVGCFWKKVEGVKAESGSVLKENQVIEKAVLDIKARVLKGKDVDQEKLRTSIDLLKKSSEALGVGIEMFESVVNELFEEIVQGRKKVLAMVDFD